jgi:hypothetical protein
MCIFSIHLFFLCILPLQNITSGILEIKLNEDFCYFSHHFVPYVLMHK